MNEDNCPLISFVIPTLNSAGHLRRTLNSIKKQKYSSKKIEILIIDAGSTDQTIFIAKSYKCKILRNINVQQEYGKFLGVSHCKGDYIFFIDSDEEIVSSSAIITSVNIFRNDNNVKFVLSSGYKLSNKFFDINDYINTFTDPFGYFMNKINWSENFSIKDISRRYGVIKKKNIIKLKKIRKFITTIDISGCNCVEANFLKKKILNKNNRSISTIFLRIYLSKFDVAINENMKIKHFSCKNLFSFFGKLKWRVISNILYKTKPGTGFTNRNERYFKIFLKKKYLFPIYSTFLIFPLIHSIYETIRTRKVICLLHVLFSNFVTFYIFYIYVIKLFGFNKKLSTYGKKTNLTIYNK